jgi:hypothetical protein
MRIDGEAPGQRIHSHTRLAGHVLGRITATSDRHRRSTLEIVADPDRLARLSLVRDRSRRRT